MTRNQERATAIAIDLWTGRLHDGDLADSDWALLLLAAGMNCIAAPAQLLSQMILDQVKARRGYFGTDTSRTYRPIESADDPTTDWFV